ncbi:MAG: hypothetical protein Q8O67_08410 [Deltaproteobacteria bacterium]|nr:hypothetical protein [Deltaproteobacteria bacterium]
MDDELQPQTLKTATTNNAQLAALTKQLELAQAEQKAGGDVDGGMFDGLTAGSLMVGLVLSTIGLGLVRYGKVMLSWMYAIFGVALMVIPFFIMDAWILVGVGVGLIALLLLLKRFVSF